MTAHVFHVADAFKQLREMREYGEQIDVLITDPPYSPHVHANLCSGSLVGTKAVPKYELPFEPLKGYTWLEDAVRITKRWVVSFSDLEAFGLIKGVCPAEYIRGCVWAKKNAMGQLTADRPATAFEGIALLHGTKDAGHPKKRWNGHGSYGIWAADDETFAANGFEANGTRGKKDRHPNEKPLDLCLKMVALFSERGETVFDPFCGSGAIGEACVLLGRHYIGMDNAAEWVLKAAIRVTETQTSGRTMTDDEALKLCQMWNRPPAKKKEKKNT